MTVTGTGPHVAVDAVRDRADIVRQVKQVVVLSIAALFTLWFAVAIEEPTVGYTFEGQVTPDSRREVDGQLVAWVALAVLVVVLVLAALNRLRRGWGTTSIFVLAGVSFYLAFLMWYYADQDVQGGFSAIAIVNPLPQAVVYATPLVLGAMAGVLCERSGVVNIAIEGQFLMGAFCAAVLSSLLYSAEGGLIGGALGGLVIAAMLAFFALRYHVEQIVVGVVLIAFALGLTSFLLGQIPGSQENATLHSYLNEPLTLTDIAIPGLSSIPVIGSALFDQSLLVYLMYVAVAIVFVLLFSTRWGLRVRAVGEHPKAADTVGVDVNRMRWSAVLLGGVFAGLGGAFFTVGSTGAFSENASNGQGFIALAAVIMGRWHPFGATLSALFFGFLMATRDQLAVLARIDTGILSAAPYLATLIVVAGFVGRIRPPAANGQPYVKS